MARLRDSVMVHVASSTSKAYSGPWMAFVEWCGSLARPSAVLPADEPTVAMYLQVIVDKTKTFAPIKSASAVIALYQNVNLYNHNPTMAPKVCMVRRAVARKFGLIPLGRKTSFAWVQLVLFAEAYGVRHQGYCHLVVVTMAMGMFEAMCRYNDVSHLRWRNIRCEPDGSSFELTFEKRKKT
jgi:hypothetical protein